MSLYHFNMKNINKASQSALAKAAYISGEKLYSERDEEHKNYRTRHHLPDSFILAPAHAPEWVYNRERLWNEAEEVEKAYNSRVAKEVVLALPVELDEDSQAKMLKEYVEETFVNDGMVADVNIHHDVEHNPHAHILLTVRPFNEDGTWWKTKSKKEYILDQEGNYTYNKSGNKKTRNVDLTGWNGPEKLIEWREKFAEKVNETYKEHGIDEEISHLSYADQGLDKIPSSRLTRSEFYVEKKNKERAVSNGSKHEPVTQYGKLNKELRTEQREVEAINNKIIELEQYKQKRQSPERKTLENIRNQYSMSEGEFEALSFVKSRSKSNYVDYDISQQTSDSLLRWERKLNSDSRKLKREQNVFSTAKKHYENNSSSLFKLGFSKKHFIPDFNSRVEDLEERFNKHREQLESFNKSKEFTEKALNMQQQLLKEEFIYLYPQYQDDVSKETRELYDIMNDYVKKFKENDVVYDSVPEIENRTRNYESGELLFRQDLQENLNEYKHYSRLYFSLNRGLKEAESTYKSDVENNREMIRDSKVSRDEVFGSAVTYLVTKNELDVTTKDYEVVREKLMSDCLELYGEHHKDTIGKLPDRIKVQLLNEYLENGEVQELSEDLNHLKDKGIDIEEKNSDSFELNQLESSSGSNAGNILSDLIEEAKKAERTDERNPKKNRWKKGKLIKEDLLDQEL